MTKLEPGPVGNVFLFVSNLDDAVEWYSGLLRAPPARPMPQLAVWELGHTRLTLHAEDEYNSSGPAAAGTVPYFDVVDADAAAALCVEQGGKVHRGPKTVFSGERLVQILDPFGNLLGLRQPPAASKRLQAAPTLETPRLTLRPVRFDDWPAFRDLMMSERAVHMGGPYSEHAAWGMFGVDHAQWDLFGVGSLMIDVKETGVCVGQVGINSGPFFPEYELGWLLFSGHEGQGYAQEAATALRDWARDVRKLPVLVSYVAPENQRSRQLAERLGATLDANAAPPDPTDLVYRHW